MLSLADAGGRIMYAYKELAELAGHTSRVHKMLEVFKELEKNDYELLSSHAVSGVTELGHESISFNHVPIATPGSTSTNLVNDLTLSINPGEHLMITGPNGSGKTSIVRVLAGIWPLISGTLLRPDASLEHIMFIPQKPYFPHGTLLDQIIYPHSRAEYDKSGYSETDLNDILRIVHLSNIPIREGGFDQVKEWKDIFSGGEKQRMQIARVFYHSPQFVVLDEATSAVSNDVEALIYQAAREHDITVISVSHRPALFKYHRFLVKVGEGADGKGWSLEKIGDGPALLKSVEAEIAMLEGQIGKAGASRVRLAEINAELNLKAVPVAV